MPGSSPRRTLAFASSLTVSITSDDALAGRWLDEFVSGWFTSTSAAPDWQVRLSSSPDAYAAAQASRPPVTPPRPCFAFDSYVLSLPSWELGEHLMVEDAERSCLLGFAPYQVDLVADPRTERWRFTAALVLLEIVATRMRRTSIDLHASAAVTNQGGLLMVGPKGAGKTTLLLHLLRSGAGRMLANDRTFVTPGLPLPLLIGTPAAVKVRAGTLARFPELRRGLPEVERPYLYSLAELAAAKGPHARETSDDLALSPPQVLRQLDASYQASAPLKAMVFPRLQPDLDTWAIEPLDAALVGLELRANLFGRVLGQRSETVVEEMGDGSTVPAPHLFEQLAGSVPGYRLLLGPRAYETGDLVKQLTELTGR